MHVSSNSHTLFAGEALLDHGATSNLLYGIVAEEYVYLDQLLEEDPDAIHWCNPRNSDVRCILR